MSNPEAPLSEMGQPATPRPKGNRLIGIDVARGIALLGMVLVNYKLKIDACDRGADWLVWFSYRLEGRAAALFIVLAGVGISLRSSRALTDPANHASYERVALLQRASILFVIGLLNLHIWEWDILHCYGLFLTFAALLLTARARTLFAVIVGILVINIALQYGFDYQHKPPLWTLSGMSADMLFNGSHPMFPWVAFLVLGMWLGRLDLKDKALCRRLMWGSFLLAIVAESIGLVADTNALGISVHTAEWFSAWPRPPLPGFIIAAGATAVCVICFCVLWLQDKSQTRWVIALSATGQLAFTLYIVHIIAIIIPIYHGFFVGSSLLVSILYSLAFFALAVVASVWWRRRFNVGPIEGFVRQITGRTTPAPWGGEPLMK